MVHEVVSKGPCTLALALNRCLNHLLSISTRCEQLPAVNYRPLISIALQRSLTGDCDWFGQHFPSRSLLNACAATLPWT